MCVLALAWNAHRHWRLIVAGNRDEFHARQALPLSRWNAPHGILAGRDLQSGGTWLGLSERGAFGVVTNFRGYGLPHAGRPSRGMLLRDLVAGGGKYSHASNTDFASFNPFNLIMVERGDACFMTNRPTPARKVLTAGIYALSNGTLNEPWLKTIKLGRFLKGWLESGATQPEILLDALCDDADLKAGSALKPSAKVQANDPMSPIFIRDTVYGTRCSTVVMVDDSSNGTVIERRFDAHGVSTGETTMTFSWPAA